MNLTPFFAHLRYGDFSDIYFEEAEHLQLVWEDGRIEQVQAGRDCGVGYHIQSGEESRYSHQGGWDYCSFAPLATALEHGLRPVRPRPAAGVLRAHTHAVRIPPATVAVERKVALLESIHALLIRSDTRIAQVSVRYGERRKKIIILTEDGRAVSEERTYSVLGVAVVAQENGQSQTAAEARGGIGGFELIEGQDLAQLCAGVAARAANKLVAPYLPACEMPVVIAGVAGGTMIHEAIGHSLEADAVQKGISPHFAGKLNAPIAGAAVSIVDDPTLAGMRGSYAVDDEGQAARPVLLVEQGILREYLYDRFTARKDSVASNAHGRRESFQSRPIPRMANTFVRPGSHTPAEIISSVERGLFVRRMGGGQVNTATGDFMFEVEEGYLIKDGRIGHLVRGASLLGNGPQALMNIDMVASDLGWSIGTCGKDGQGVPVADGMPTLRIANILVGGAADK